jgi:hypothetical protein
MEFKNPKELSNAELRLYQEDLKNEFEAIKREIKEKFDELDKLDREYVKADAEMNNRRNVKY